VADLKKPAPKNEPDEESGAERITNDLIHAEIRMLYAESTETMRFVKNHQWKTVGATLLTFLGIIFVAGFVNADRDLTSSLMGITILLGAAVMFTLVIYQFWMFNELRKINAMEPMFSEQFHSIRALKSNREGTLHRYTLLVFMMTVIVLGGLVVHLALDKIARGY